MEISEPTAKAPLELNVSASDVDVYIAFSIYCSLFGRLTVHASEYDSGKGIYGKNLLIPGVSS